MPLTKILELSGLTPYLVATAITLIVTLITAIATKKKPLRITAAIATGLAALVLVIGCAILTVYPTAIAHGATMEMLEEHSLQETIYHTQNSFEMSDISLIDTSVGNSFILYYRWDCNDCADTYKDIKAYIDEHPIDIPIYYISSRSETGQALLEKYNVGSVPSLIYVYPNEFSSFGETLYIKQSEDKPAIFDERAMRNLFDRFGHQN